MSIDSIRKRLKNILDFSKDSISYMDGVYSSNKFINLLYIIPQIPYRYYLYLKAV